MRLKRVLACVLSCTFLCGSIVSVQATEQKEYAKATTEMTMQELKEYFDVQNLAEENGVNEEELLQAIYDGVQRGDITWVQ